MAHDGVFSYTVHMIRDDIHSLIRGALDDLSLGGDFTLEHPADFAHGDYATNAALVAAKKVGKNPRAVADELVRYIVQKKPETVAKVEVAGPGFINFHLSKEFFTESISRAVTLGERWGKNDALSGVRAVVEYTDPNPFKEFHIGHLVPNTVGESISRLLAFSGAEVKRANYQGDVGLHVAKAVWGLMRSNTLPTTAAELGKAYAAGASAYDSDAGAKEEIVGINKKIYERSDARVNELYDAGRKLSLDYFETVYRTLGTSFDLYFFESEAGPVGSGIVREHTGTIFTESDGAVVFRGEDHGLHTRVFITSEGLPTYEAKELGLAKMKSDRSPHDLSVVVTGNEIAEYFKVLLAAMKGVFPELAEKTKHVPHGMLRLAGGKMSSRTGNVIPAVDLIREVAKAAGEKMRASSVVDAESVAERVAVGAVKYAILRQGTGRDTIFDFDRALSLEGDSGPYLEYALARALSVVRKAPGESVEAKAPSDISEVERLLYRFPEVVERAAFEYEPHYVTTYLTSLAGAFNSWYASTRILDAGAESAYRVLLTRAFATTMRNGLTLLGIPVLERM